MVVASARSNEFNMALCGGWQAGAQVRVRSRESSFAAYRPDHIGDFGPP